MSFLANVNCKLTFPPHYQNQPIINIFKQIGNLEHNWVIKKIN